VISACLCMQFVADGVFYAELNELLTRELAEHGYSGVDVRVTPVRTEIIIRATRTQNVLGAGRKALILDNSQEPCILLLSLLSSCQGAAGPQGSARTVVQGVQVSSLLVPAGVKGRRIRELTSVVQKRFKFPENTVELYAEKVANRGLCAIAQAESLRYKLLGGLAVRRCGWQRQPRGLAGRPRAGP
jgi:small subunit ribosomal protein S3e